MNDVRPDPLDGVKGNPRRSAAASFRGDMFQIWHSVHAWITLKPNECLFLERGEDFDIANKSGVQVVQTKDLRSTITLRSDCVREAIDNFWGHKQNNPGLVIDFRFLTTASLGNEAGRPFGNTPGLKQWRIARKEETAALHLKEFLLKENKLSSAMLAYIKGATAQELQHELLEPLTWVTESKDFEDVKQAALNQLIYHGERWGVSPSD